jgi:predicted DNA-binding protein with PD1-like motif
VTGPGLARGLHRGAIGAVSDATYLHFDWERKAYRRMSAPEQLEVISFAGNFAEKDGKPKRHGHVVLARSDGSVVGGHLLRAHVRPTLEALITETPSYLRRRFDEQTGLPLIDPSL